MPVLHSTVRDWFALSLSRAGLPDEYTPHACRRTYSDLLRLAGLDTRTIADLLGHESVTTTSAHYMSVLHPMAVRAADGLEALFH